MLDGVVRPYAWGSRTAIAALQGRSMPSQEPEAELWLGAHPAGSSQLRGGQSLTDAIAADPDGVLGARSQSQFGARLPFLMKVLAAEQPLSLQAHPDEIQAADGYAREERAGLALDSPQRNYVDVFHKPELLVAAGEFEALCGFRDPRASADSIAGLGVEGLDFLVAQLRQDDPSQALREAVTTLLTLPTDHRAELVRQAATAAADLTGDARHGADYALVADLGKRYPYDAGAVVAMLLNQVHLQEGEAIYMPAGTLHAYLRGVGIEVMAASDNVLRGGLTSKHVDVPELLRVLRFEVLEQPRLKSRESAPGQTEWDVPVSEFRLSRLRLDAGLDVAELAVSHIDGPAVVLCWAGQIRLDDGVSAVTLRPGQAGFARADSGAVWASGYGEVYCVTLGEVTSQDGVGDSVVEVTEAI